ncbi:hypothetical protein CGSSa00_13067 [Staphylococcus aureus subsp. aureus CGS00]|nr:hypothetical protein CGSSa00_13067 [Staphylococcus aureus subsp. aureus CGS00]EOR42104.1 hypothetical protein S122051_1388 [Staphylococcus aureus subsp. aureus 122051]
MLNSKFNGSHLVIVTVLVTIKNHFAQCVNTYV